MWTWGKTGCPLEWARQLKKYPQPHGFLPEALWSGSLLQLFWPASTLYWHRICIALKFWKATSTATASSISSSTLRSSLTASCLTASCFSIPNSKEEEYYGLGSSLMLEENTQVLTTQWSQPLGQLPSVAQVTGCKIWPPTGSPLCKRCRCDRHSYWPSLYRVTLSASPQDFKRQKSYSNWLHTRTLLWLLWVKSPAQPNVARVTGLNNVLVTCHHFISFSQTVPT
jgi:hypothetical protein